MKKKILFLVQLPDPKHGQSLINQLILNNTKLKIFFDIKFIDISTTKVIEEINGFKFKKILTFINILFKLIKSLITYKPDRVYISISILGLGFLKDSFLVIILKLFRIKSIFHLHRKGLSSSLKNSLFKKIYYKFIFKNADIIHLSKILFKDIKDIRDKNTKNYVVHNGILNKNKFYIKKNNVFTFIFVSNLFNSKGINILLKSVLSLNNQMFDKKYQLKIIGNYTKDFTKRDAQKFLHENKLFNNVSFIGAKYGKEKFKNLSNSHVKIFLTKDDCFPLCLLEALSFGLPIISTYEGAIPEIVKNKRNGILIKNLKIFSIVNAMKKYINNPKMLKFHSKNNIKDFKEKYDIKIFEKSFLYVFKKIMR